MRNAVFLVKNGIGFGHIRRALLIAEAVQTAGRLRPIVVSQASSLALYRDTPVRVVNFPLLHRVPSAITEDFYTDLMDRLLDRLNPAVVIEDTYPDARYRRLSALADRPRILVMRRLDGLSFDQLRERGDFAHYEHVLIAQDEPDFHAEGHSGESLAAVESSGRFTFVGNIAYRPRPADVHAVRADYTPPGTPLIVVNGGAGGDQMPDGYGDRLFHACHDIAATLAHEGHPARFVLVTGPYYAGRPLPETPNVTVRRFEPRLPSLLAAADVAVIKPGNNAVSETLAGHAQMVLAPDVSFMEGLDEHSARLAAQYAGAVATPDRDSLEPLIRGALARGPRQNHRPSPRTAVDAAVRKIHKQAEAGADGRLEAKTLLLVLLPPQQADPDTLRASIGGRLADAIVAGDNATVTRLSQLEETTEPVEAVIVDEDPGHLTPRELTERGVRLLIQYGATPALQRHLRDQPPRPALLMTSAEMVVARPNFPAALSRRVAGLLRTRAVAVVLLDLGRLSSSGMKEYLDAVEQWLARQPLRLVETKDVAGWLGDQLMER